MKLRKITLLLFANVLSIGLLAEGYQLNLQSTKQLGMGHLGAALKLGGESMLFNPAGMAFMENNSELSLGVNGVISKIKYSTGTSSTFTQNPLGTPIFGYYSLKLSDKFVAGISISNPAGNSLKWGNNWPGQMLVQEIGLEAFSVQPTIAIKLSDKFSVGAGIMFQFGDFSLTKGLVPVGGLSQLALGVPTFAPVINEYKSYSPVSLNLSGSSKIGIGFNVGFLYDISPKVSIGVSYRSKVKMTVQEGVTKVEYIAPAMGSLIKMAAAIPSLAATFAPIVAIDGQGFNVSLPIPSNLKVGVAYKPTDKFTASAEIDYVGWKAYDKLVFDFDADAFGVSEVQKNFKNTFIYRGGIEYKSTDKVTARLGIIYDATPVDVNLYGAETPGSNNFSATTGFTFKMSKKCDLDIALQYLNGKKINGSTPTSPTTTFAGTYKKMAFIPSIGLKFNF